MKFGDIKFECLPCILQLDSLNFNVFYQRKKNIISYLIFLNYLISSYKKETTVFPCLGVIISSMGGRVDSIAIRF